MNKKNISVALLFLTGLVGIFIYIFFASINTQDNSSGTWVTHRSKEYSYKITSPEDWIFDNSHRLSPADALHAPERDAEVYIEVRDEILTDELETRKKVIENIKDELENYPGHTVLHFEMIDEDGYVSNGTFDNNENIWVYQELGRFNIDGRFFITRANIIQTAVSEYQPIINRIFSSFSPL